MTILVPVHRALSTKLAGRSFNVVSRLGYNSWLARVNHNSDNYESNSTPQAPLGRIYSISTRTYATAAARKPASRPKAHTGRTAAKRTTKAATTKKPGPKTPAGKARVGAKPKAKTTKAKAKLKPKPKTPVKKTPTKRALDKERVAKEKALKEAALLDSPKQLPASAWQVFFGESLKGSHGPSETPQMAKDAGQKYKNITPEEKEHYNHVAHVNKEKNEKAYKQWLSQHTPEQIYQANVARRQLKKIYNEKHPNTKHTLKYKPIHDDRLVKNVMSAFIYFSMDRHLSGDFHRMSLSEAGPLVAREWKALSAQEKKKYEDKQEADRQRYVEEYTTVYGKEPPETRKKAAKAP